jgi:hypothetical protein
VKQEQIEIGNVYTAKVTDKVVPVRIDAEHPSGGWHAVNTTTNRKVHIKSAAKLRKQIKVPNAEATKPAAKQPAKKKLTVAERRARFAASSAKPKSDAPATTKADAPKEKRLSLIDAAIQVLSDAKHPMSTKQMVEQITEQGLWSPGTGKTPHATLYSAILRELQKKRSDARFTKVERGQFTLATKGA